MILADAHARLIRIAARRTPAIVAAVAGGAVLAMLGPFGSYLNGGPVRLAVYWIGATLLGLVLYGTAYRIATTSRVRRWSRRRPALVAAMLLASVPEAFATRVAAFRLWPDLARVRLPWSLWFAQTVAIGAICILAAELVIRRSRSVPDAGPAPVIPPDRDRVLGSGAVLALQMEDHYVRVHRPAGSELILMPLGRAIERVAAEGLRTHRSWWVARDAVVGVEGDARSLRLRLSNGMSAPVARSAVARLRAAGWLADMERGRAITRRISR